MSATSTIEWTDASWNPIRAMRTVKTLPGHEFAAMAEATSPGASASVSVVDIGWHCEKVSAGCANCYAEKINLRLGTKLEFKPGHRADVTLFLDEKMLLAPLRWKRARKIFVGSMTDLFAGFVTDEWLDRVFAVMALCPQHTFQLLTKRPERMRRYIPHAERRTAKASVHIEPLSLERTDLEASIQEMATEGWEKWPLPNVWLGTSVEDQPTADERISHLLNTPAAVRFLSCEPLLGPIDLGFNSPCDHVRRTHEEIGCWMALNWVIAGGESGPKARPMHPDWPRSLRDQCGAAGVPFFFKQWGEYFPQPITNIGADGEVWREGPNGRRHWYADELNIVSPPEFRMSRVGKKAAGRLLDNRTHSEFP